MKSPHPEIARQIVRCLSDAAALLAFEAPDPTMTRDGRAQAFREQVTRYGDLMNEWLDALDKWAVKP